MASIEIYHGKRLVEERTFNGNFYLNSRDGVLFWQFEDTELHTDNQEVMRYSETYSQKITELIKLTPQSMYFFQVIRPDWTLRINEIDCPRGGYLTVDVYWRNIKLIFRDYQFCFTFTSEDTIVREEEPLPVPDVRRNDLLDADTTFPL